jgi:hypothetical protein
VNPDGALSDKRENGLKPMKRAVIAATLLLCPLAPAFATTHYEMTWRDMVRPHGHKRSQMVYDADLNTCYDQTGQSRETASTPGFKTCMKSRGYRWISTRLVRDPPDKARDDSFIDPDTGMSCRNIGGASICEPPQGTVRYINKHGLSCTRTGAASICTNL